MPSTDYTSSEGTINDRLFYDSNLSTLTNSHKEYIRSTVNGSTIMHQLCLTYNGKTVCIKCTDNTCSNYLNGSGNYDITSEFSDAGFTAEDDSLSCYTSSSSYGGCVVGNFLSCSASSAGQFGCGDVTRSENAVVNSSGSAWVG